MPNVCVAVGCGNRTKFGIGEEEGSGPKVSFHKFPLHNKSLLKQWLARLRRQNFVPKSHSTLCSDHFDEDAFDGGLQFKYGFEKKRRLKPDAVPSLFKHTKPVKRRRHTEERIARLDRERFCQEVGIPRTPAIKSRSSTPREKFRQEYDMLVEGGIPSLEYHQYKRVAATKQLRMLKFANPGKFMEDFDPERSSREMRKVNRRIYRETLKKNQVYDEIGRVLADSRDICDCLQAQCPGCHFPCSKCDSPKCGTECRCSRRWYYSEIEIEGTDKKVMFPGPLPQPSY